MEKIMYDMENILIPNESYANFVLGDNIDKYLHLSHSVEHINEELYTYDSYDFYDLNLILWVENNKIETICCDTDCYWHNENLIGLLYERFLTIAKQQPDEEDCLYVPTSKDRGQNQKVYTFKDLGLQIWVWRKKIVTVLVSRYDDEDDVISSVLS